ncbi:MAG: hypothetical protein IPL27_25090 [Lewinellaceae bacterium]|nr:hypothetical protein [Lewinellaceae bacterium]
MVSLIENISEEFEKNFLVEAIWKFLIITEIALNLYKKLKEKPVQSIIKTESDFIAFIDKNKDLYHDDISIRLENIIERVKNNLNAKLKQQDFKNKMTEALHTDTIYITKRHLVNIVGKDKKIILLIDNLDKSWRRDSKIITVSKIILGLVNSADKIVRDISMIRENPIKLSVKLSVFLRSDIYKNIIQYATEPDKINPIWLKWTDYEVFFRIIEERFSVLNNKDASELWSKYATAEVDGQALQDFILERILPRPRDVIFFFTKSQEIAIARGHSMMNADDFKMPIQNIRLGFLKNNDR